MLSVAVFSTTKENKINLNKITTTQTSPNPKCKLWHLCFERDLFLRVLERERDRRGLLDRLEERFFVSALSGRGGFSIRAQQNCIILMAKNPRVENVHVVPGSIAAAIVDWASLTLFITLSSSLAAACGVSSGGFTMALLE